MAAIVLRFPSLHGTVEPADGLTGAAFAAFRNDHEH